MEYAALWISLVTAVGTAAAAIMAWTARSDALSAQASAEKAQTAALDAWQRAAGALERANEIQLRISEDAISRHSLQARTSVAESLRRWYTEHAIRIAIGVTPSDSERDEKRDLSIRLAGTGEPGATALALALEDAMRTIERGEIETAMAAGAKVMNLTRTWTRDPSAFNESEQEQADIDALRGDVERLKILFDAVSRPKDD